MLVKLNRNRSSGTVLESVALLLVAAFQLGASDPGQPIIYTHARDIQELPANEAATERAVNIRAVVTYSDQQLGRLFVQDETSGIYVYLDRSQADAPLHAGDFVSIEGVTAPGAFSPCITKARINHLGVRPLPKPEHLTFEDLLSGEADSNWVEVKGVVRSGQIRQGRLSLNVKIRGGNVIAILTSYAQDWSRSLIDSKIVISGAVAQIHYQRRQSIGVRIFVPTGFLRILERAPADPFLLPESSTESIRSYRKDTDFDHRIRIRGVVTGVEPGQSLFVAGKDGKLEIQGRPACTGRAGDVVDVVGFPGAVEIRPGLLDSICRKVSVKASVDAIPLKAEQVLVSPNAGDASKYDYAASSRYDMSLVQMDGRLLQNSPGPEGTVLLLASGGKQFIASLPGSNGTMLQGLGTGSMLRLTGLCLLNYDEYRRAQSFRILLRTRADIVVLKIAPWWNLENAMRVLSVMAVILMAAIIWVARQTIHLRRANQALHKLSFQDGLTGVANRRRFDEKLSTELRRAARTSTPVSLIMLDIDYFKRLNDRCGHQRGDECLVLVARALQSVKMRFTDLVARYGGEEFAIILPGTEPDTAFTIAESVRDAVVRLALPHEDSPFQHVTTSAGIATVWPDRYTSSASLIAMADQALYLSKEGGRNRVSCLDANVAQGVC